MHAIPGHHSRRHYEAISALPTFKNALTAVTTGTNNSPELLAQAEQIGRDINLRCIPRNFRSIKTLMEQEAVDRVLIVRQDRYSLQDKDENEYQFHPNLAIVRATNFNKRGSDHYLEAVALRSGETVIDCTLGFGCEALLSALLVGVEGEVIGLESVPELAVVTREGMRRYTLLQNRLEEAMRRVVVLNRDYRDYLPQCRSRSADVIYFDPFFKDTLEKSSLTVNALAAFGNRAPLDIRSIVEARRVSRRSVVIKHPKYPPLPDEIQDQVRTEISGRNSPVSFAVIDSF